jgi:hypothetical protein
MATTPLLLTDPLFYMNQNLVKTHLHERSDRIGLTKSINQQIAKGWSDTVPNTVCTTPDHSFAHPNSHVQQRKTFHDSSVRVNSLLEDNARSLGVHKTNYDATGAGCTGPFLLGLL